MNIFCLTGPLRVGKGFLLEQLIRDSRVQIPRWHSVKTVRSLFVETVTEAELAGNIAQESYCLVDQDLYGTYHLPFKLLDVRRINLLPLSLSTALRWRQTQPLQIIYILPDEGYRTRTTNKAWKEYRDNRPDVELLAQTDYQVQLTNPTNKVLSEIKSILFNP